MEMRGGDLQLKGEGLTCRVEVYFRIVLMSFYIRLMRSNLSYRSEYLLYLSLFYIF